MIHVALEPENRPNSRRIRSIDIAEPGETLAGLVAEEGEIVFGVRLSRHPNKELMYKTAGRLMEIFTDASDSAVVMRDEDGTKILAAVMPKESKVKFIEALAKHLILSEEDVALLHRQEVLTVAETQASRRIAVMAGSVAEGSHI